MERDWRWRLYKLLVYIDVDCGEQELGFAIGIEGVEKLEKLVESELDKAREEGRQSIIAQLSISENMEAIEGFFREAPIDYDDKCNLWIDFLSKLNK